MENLGKIQSLEKGKGLKVDDLPMAFYHLPDTGLSKSGIAQIHKGSLYDYHWWSKRTKKPTLAMELGTLFHSLILEPEAFKSEYAIWRGSKNSNAWMIFKEENVGKTIVSEKQLQTACLMKTNCQKNGIARRLESEKGEVECSYFYREPVHDVLLKARPDKYLPESNIVVDVKTSSTVEPRDRGGFQAKAYDLMYYVSAYLTLHLMEKVNGRKPEEYLYLAVSNKEPYRSIVYRATNEELELGKYVIEKTLPLFAEAIQTGTWSDYEERIYDCGLPKWADDIDTINGRRELSFEQFTAIYSE